MTVQSAHNTIMFVGAVLTLGYFAWEIWRDWMPTRKQKPVDVDLDALIDYYSDDVYALARIHDGLYALCRCGTQGECTACRIYLDLISLSPEECDRMVNDDDWGIHDNCRQQPTKQGKDEHA